MTEEQKKIVEEFRNVVERIEKLAEEKPVVMKVVEAKPDIMPKPKYLKVDEIPIVQPGNRKPFFDNVISWTQQEPIGSTIVPNFADEGISAKQGYSGMHPRVERFNSNPGRDRDLVLAQRKDKEKQKVLTYIKSLPKDSLQHKQD